MISTSMLGRWLIRICIIIFWIIVFTLFLLLPHVAQKFSSQKSITVLTWPTIIDPGSLVEFEKQTGIKVYLRYFENNEELLVKIKETKGVGYDLIMPSDYTVQQLIGQDLLKKIDKTRLPFVSDIYPHLLGSYYDTLNEYSIPYYWSIYGIAYNKDYFKGITPRASWGLVFDEHLAQPHTCMIDDARESVLIASKFLYRDQNSLSDAQLKQIKQVLIKQKKWIELYSEERSNFMLASKACPVAVIFSSIVSRIMRYYDFVDFLIPQEGTFIVVDAFCIPQVSVKDDLVYQFLNFVYKPEILSSYIKKFGFFSPLKTVKTQGRVPFPSAQQLETIQFFKNIVPKNKLSKIWIDLKS